MATAAAQPHANGVMTNGLPGDQPGVPPSSQPAQAASVAPQGPNSQVNMAPAYTTIPSASLYVGELDPTTNEAMIYELFNTIGQVASVRVCRDAMTKRSLGYAYVNYHTVQDGERALETLNYTPIKGKPCRIMWSQRDPSLRKSGTGNIFIKNLDPSIDNKALHDTFSAFGNILSCKVVMTEDGQSKGYGFVHYETQEAAENAIKSVNGMMMNDQQVFVGHHIPKKERLAKLEEQRAKFTNLYIKNIPEDFTDEQVRTMFEKFGTIVSAAVKSDEQNPGMNKGFAFVNFEDHVAAKAAVDALHETEHGGKKLYVQRAQKKAERQDQLQKQFEQAKQEKLQRWQDVNLYVKNLDDDMDEEKLTKEFAPFGTIQSVKIMRDEKQGISRGFGFVCFSDPAEAKAAVKVMNSKMVGSKPLYVAPAQRKEHRRAELEAKYAQRHQRAAYPPMIPGVPTPPMFPGGPMMYGPPGAMAQRSFFIPPGMMGPRPRWQQPGQAPQGPPTGPYGQMAPPPHGPQHPGFNPGSMHMNPAGRPGRAMRGGPPRSMPPQGRHQPQQGRPASKKPVQAKMTGANPMPTQNGTGKENVADTNAAAQPSTRDVPISQEQLASLDETQQKQVLGEAIYLRIQHLAKDYTGKVTGMLIELDNTQLLGLLADMPALETRVKDALEAIKQHNTSTTKAEDKAE